MNELLDRIRTKDEADKLLAEIDLLLSSIYKSEGEGIENVLRTKVRFWVARILREQFGKGKEGKASLLKKAKQKLEGTKIMSLNLAFEPNDEIVDRLSNYVNSSFGEKMFLEIIYQPELIGGAVIIHQGKYSDFSIKKIFESEFEENVGEILSLLG